MKITLKILITLCIIYLIVSLPAILWYVTHISYLTLIDCINAIIIIFFPFQIIFLSIHKIRNINDFKTDFLLYKPKWLSEINLGKRRLFSIFTSILLLGSIILHSFIILKVYDFFSSGNDLPFFQLWFIIIYWLIWLISCIVFWVFKGFKTQQ